MTSGGTFVCHIPVIGTLSQSVLIINVLAALSENVNIEVLVVHFCIYHCIAPAIIFNLKCALTLLASDFISDPLTSSPTVRSWRNRYSASCAETSSVLVIPIQ
jgi:hypothetical protein